MCVTCSKQFNMSSFEKYNNFGYHSTKFWLKGNNNYANSFTNKRKKERKKKEKSTVKAGLVID